MRSSLFTDGEKYVCQGTSVSHEVAINDQMVVQKLKPGVTLAQWMDANSEEKPKLVESVLLGGSALGFRDVAPNSCCTILNSKNVPRGYTSLSTHQRFLVDMTIVRICFCLSRKLIHSVVFQPRIL